MNKTLGILILVFLLVASVFGFRVLFNTQFRSARASNALASICHVVPSSVNISCQEGTNCDSAVAVVVTSATGDTIGGVKVSLLTNFGNLTPATNTTDATGVANFALSASASGLAQLNATADGTRIRCESATVAFDFRP